MYTMLHSPWFNAKWGDQINAVLLGMGTNGQALQRYVMERWDTILMETLRNPKGGFHSVCINTVKQRCSFCQHTRQCTQRIYQKGGPLTWRTGSNCAPVVLAWIDWCVALRAACLADPKDPRAKHILAGFLGNLDASMTLMVEKAAEKRRSDKMEEEREEDEDEDDEGAALVLGAARYGRGLRVRNKSAKKRVIDGDDDE